MTFIDFTNSDKVNVAVIDNQHKDIADTINKIYNSSQHKNKSEVSKFLNVLIEIIETHFETEEKFMKEFHYPGYISHKLEHDRFYNQILITTDRFNKGDLEIGSEQLDKMKRWFFNHLDLNDKKCGDYLRTKGVS